MKLNNFLGQKNKLRERHVESIVAPQGHVDGEHLLNFINETVEMLASEAPVLPERHRQFLERCLARRTLTGRPHTISHHLVMSDGHWRAWRDVRGLFLALRYAVERRAAVSSMAA